MSSHSSIRKSMSGFITKDKSDIIRSILAEFVGTAILVLFTCGTCVQTSGKGDALVSTALSFGLTVTCLAATIGHVSGCHINPGVTVGLLTNGQISPIKAIAYILSQLLGGIAGASVLAAVLPSGADNLCATALNKDISPVQGIIIEGFIVFLLVFVVCNVCESNSNLAPVTIGLAVTTGHLFAIPLTSSSMNTARSLGPAVIQGYWDDHYVYWVGPLLGGAVGGLFHRYIFQNKTFYGKCLSVSTSGEPTNVTTTI